MSYGMLFIAAGASLWTFAKPAKLAEFGRLLMLAGLIYAALHYGDRRLLS